METYYSLDILAREINSERVRDAQTARPLTNSRKNSRLPLIVQSLLAIIG